LQNKFDAIFILFVIILSIYYYSYISRIAFPVWDAGVYLQNAQDWLRQKPLTASYRPPLISWIIAGVWSVTGEDWTSAKYVQAIFTISAGIILYLTLRKHKGAPFALGVSVLTMLNSYVFYFSTQILTEGISLFFLVLSLYFLKSKMRYSGVFAGIAIALTFASRYPIFLQAFTLLIVEVVTRRDAKLLIKALAALVPIMVLFVAVGYEKSGQFSVAISQDVQRFTLSFSPFYIENFIQIFGFASLLAPIALFFKRTYSDQYNYVFIGWLVVGLLFWSSISGNHQERFMIQLTPAVYFLAVLAIENIWKTNKLSIEALSNFKRYIARKI